MFKKTIRVECVDTKINLFNDIPKRKIFESIYGKIPYDFDVYDILVTAAGAKNRHLFYCGVFSLAFDSKEQYVLFKLSFNSEKRIN